MINIDQVRVSFKNYRGTEESACRMAKRTVERLEQMSAEDVRIRGVFRIVDRAICEPLRIAGPFANEDAIAESAAARAWQTILGHL
jgi:hypothetical protein